MLRKEDRDIVKYAIENQILALHNDIKMLRRKEYNGKAVELLKTFERLERRLKVVLTRI